MRFKSGSKSGLLWVITVVIALLVVVLAGCAKTEDSKVTREQADNQVIVAATRVAATGLGEALKNITGESQRVDFVRRFINPIRFMDDDSGYFFVYDYNCKNITIGVFSDLVGQDLTNLKDTKGKYFIQDFVEVAKKGGGFSEYYWYHTLTKVEMRKISYIMPIPGTAYLIGSGYYPDVPAVK